MRIDTRKPFSSPTAEDIKQVIEGQAAAEDNEPLLKIYPAGRAQALAGEEVDAIVERWKNSPKTLAEQTYRERLKLGLPPWLFWFMLSSLILASMCEVINRNFP